MSESSRKAHNLAKCVSVPHGKCVRTLFDLAKCVYGYMRSYSEQKKKIHTSVPHGKCVRTEVCTTAGRSTKATRIHVMSGHTLTLPLDEEQVMRRKKKEE